MLLLLTDGHYAGHLYLLLDYSTFVLLFNVLYCNHLPYPYRVIQYIITELWLGDKLVYQ
jgi:hypothetical protein